MAEVSDYLETVKSGKLGRFPIWAVAGVGAVGLYLITRGNKSSDGVNTLQTSENGTGGVVPPVNYDTGLPYDDTALRGDIAGYNDATRSQLDALGADINARFGDSNTKLSDIYAQQDTLYRDFSGGLATQQTEFRKTQDLLSGGLNRVDSGFASISANQKTQATNAQVASVEKKVDTLTLKLDRLAEQETARDQRMANTVSKIDSILKSVSGMSVTKLPVTR